MRASTQRGSKPATEPPVDFSFMFLNNLEDVRNEQPRENRNSVHRRTEDGKLQSHSLKLNNNNLSDLSGISQVAEKYFVNVQTVQWLDVSFNRLESISESLLLFTQLKVLNMHCNLISVLSEVDKLCCLRQLSSLSLHGNPFDTNKQYRPYILAQLAQVKKLDFSAVTKGERAVVTHHMDYVIKLVHNEINPPKRVRKKKQDFSPEFVLPQ